MSAWWQPPRLRQDDQLHGERTATWLELVYDLVFVVAFAELASRFEGDLTRQGLVTFILLTVPLWWVWMGVALYDDRFATDDLSQRLITLAQMLAAAGLALTVADATGEHRQGFAVAYIAARALTTALLWRAGRHDARAKPLTSRLALGSTLALVPWLLSLLVAPPAQYALWIVGLAIDILAPLTTGRASAGLPALSATHLPERYRLLIIIVIGEAVAGAMHGAATNVDLPLLSGAFGLSLAFMLAWTAMDGALRGGGWPGWRGTALGYLLLPLVLALMAFGSALSIIVGGETGTSGAIGWLLCLSVAATLVTLGVMELVSGAVRRPRWRGWGAALRFVAAAIVLVIGLAAPLTEAWRLLAVLLVVVAAQTVLGLARSTRETVGADAG